MTGHVTHRCSPKPRPDIRDGHVCTSESVGILKGAQVVRSDNRNGPRHTIRVSALARRTITPLSGLLRISGFALSSDAGRTARLTTSRFICNLKGGAARFLALL